MVDFALSDAQRALQAEARRFARDVIQPQAAMLDRDGAFPHAIIDKAYAAGWMNALLPKAVGGAGRSVFDEMIVGEELAAACCAVTLAMRTNELALLPIVFHGTDDQRKRFVLPFCEAPRFAAFAINERERGVFLETRIERRGDRYLLNGHKGWVSNGGVASQILVIGSQDREQGPAHVTALIVDKASKGVSVQSYHDKMGLRACETVEISFDNVEVPLDRLLGLEGQGYAVAQETQIRFRAMGSSWATGIARAALEHAVRYMQKRTVRSQPLTDFQGLQFMVADMGAAVESARLLAWHLAWKIDAGMSAVYEDAVAKLTATDAALKNAINAVQIHGANGYVRAFPVEKLMRDAKGLQIGGGTDQVLRLMAAESLFAAVPKR